MDDVRRKNFQNITERIESKNSIIGIIGLGYVGLPLAFKMVEQGYSVIGFDKDLTKILQLNNHTSYIADLVDGKVKEIMKTKKFIPTNKFEQLEDTDVIVICVPTPINKDGSPNVSYIAEAAKSIGQYAKANTIIILESTTYPRTTRDIIYPVLESKGYTVGEDVFLAFSPERIDPGNISFKVDNTTKVVGGLTPQCTKLTRLFYERTLNIQVHCVSSPEVAEMEKLLENTFRQVNIALVNELSKICHAMNIDVWEVIRAAATKPYGFMPFTPGPGVGGHCIPVDPKYLLWAGEQYGFSSKMIETADKINESMPKFVVERLNEYLGQQKKLIIIGIAYKPNINDIRESPAIAVIEQLLLKNYQLEVVDPYITSVKLQHSEIQTTNLTKELLQEADGVIILTNHTNIDYRLIDREAALIFDTRNTNYPFGNKKYYRL